MVFHNLLLERLCFYEWQLQMYDKGLKLLVNVDYQQANKDHIAVKNYPKESQ